jgi:hypothetical protein
VFVPDDLASDPGVLVGSFIVTKCLFLFFVLEINHSELIL